MGEVCVHLNSVDGTGATLGRAGGHTLTVDRPAGVAGGAGLGFNGAQLLGLALGGCYCNDLHYTAAEMGLAIARLAVSVTLDLEGDPLRAVAARMTVDCALDDGGATDALLARARARCTVANSLTAGLTVDLAAG